MRAATIGSATIDHYIFTKPRIVWKKKEELIAYPLGSKIHVTKTFLTTGGGGTNSAAVFKKIGIDTIYIGRIGSDPYGEIVLKKLNELGIGFNGSINGETAYSIILDAVGHDRTIFVYKGTSNDLSKKEIDIEKLIDIDILYMSNTLGKTLKTTKWIIRNINAKIKAFNPSEYMIREAYRDVLFLAKNSNIVIMNKEEAELLARIKGEEKKLIQKLVGMVGERIIVITDGPRGATAYSSGEIYHVPAKKIRVIDSTGAGDSFAATLTAMIALGKNIEESMKIAIINAESVISEIGAKNGILTLKELEKRLRRDRRRVKQL